MRELLRSTIAYRSIAAEGKTNAQAQAALVFFPDEPYLRALLRECAKAFFCAEDSSRESMLIEKERFADCLFFPSEGGKLTADDCARIVDESLLRPVEGNKKLFVLDGFHTATPLVQNKLLKVLEEPPRGVHFLLGAAAEFSVLPTVRSRVKKYIESPFSETLVQAALKRKYSQSDKKDILKAAAASGGIFSTAEQLLLGGGEQFRLAERFLTATDIVSFSREIGEYKEKRTFFSALSLLLRDMLFYREGQGQYAALDSAERLSEEYPAGALIAALEQVREAEKQIQFNANFGQCVFALALGIQKEKIKWQKLS